MKHKTILRWQAVTSTISATMVLVLLGILTLFVLTAKEIRDSVREDLTVTVVLADGIMPAEAHVLEKKLMKRRYVHHLTFISSEQALKEQVESMGIDKIIIYESSDGLRIQVNLRADFTEHMIIFDTLGDQSADLKVEGKCNYPFAMRRRMRVKE